MTHIPGSYVQPRSWTIELPAGMTLINANDRLHWAVKARLTKTIRDAAHIITRQAKVPRLEKARIEFFFHPGPRIRRRDAANWFPSAKAAVDGVVDAGVLADDSDEFLEGPIPRRGEAREKSQLVLVITEQAPEVGE